MKQEIAEKWVAKLRSGEIEQGTGYLGRSTGERCCLGILCDMAVEAGVIRPPTEKGGGLPYLLYAGTEDIEGFVSVLPDVVMVWAGMKTRVGTYTSDSCAGDHQSLSQKNDTGHDFKYIADTIEAHVKVL